MITEVMMNAFDFGKFNCFFHCQQTCADDCVRGKKSVHVCLCDSAEKLYDSAEVLKSLNEGAKLWLFVYR